MENKTGTLDRARLQVAIEALECRTLISATPISPTYRSQPDLNPVLLAATDLPTLQSSYDETIKIKGSGSAKLTFAITNNNGVVTAVISSTNSKVAGTYGGTLSGASLSLGVVVNGVTKAFSLTVGTNSLSGSFRETTGSDTPPYIGNSGPPSYSPIDFPGSNNLKIIATGTVEGSGLPVTMAPLSDAEISALPAMPSIPVSLTYSDGFSLAGAAKYSGTISYDGPDHRHFTYKLAGSADSSTFDLSIQAGVIVGGTLKISVSVPVVEAATGNTRTYLLNGTCSITGTNPTKAAVRDALPNVDLQCISFTESGFLQFSEDDGDPIFGPKHGYGVMQIDTKTPQPLKQIWDWTANVQAGIDLFNSKQRIVGRHYDALEEKPGVTELTPDQLEKAVIQFYNGGYYWIWNKASDSWQENPKLPIPNASRGVPYADYVFPLVQQVVQGNYPSGWFD